MPDPGPIITVVTPVFKEEAVLPELFARLGAHFDGNPGCTWRADQRPKAPVIAVLPPDSLELRPPEEKQVFAEMPESRWRYGSAREYDIEVLVVRRRAITDSSR